MFDVKTFQQEVRELAETFEDRNIEKRMLFLLTEIGEVSEEVIKLVRSQKLGNTEKLEEAKSALGKEIYDAIWNLVDLANLADIDLATSFEQKIAYNKSRKWKSQLRED